MLMADVIAEARVARLLGRRPSKIPPSKPPPPLTPPQKGSITLSECEARRPRCWRRVTFGEVTPYVRLTPLASRRPVRGRITVRGAGMRARAGGRPGRDDRSTRNGRGCTSTPHRR